MVRRALAAAVAALVAASTVAAQEPTASDEMTATQLAFACGPRPVLGPAPAGAPRVVGSQTTDARGLFGARDVIVIGSGAGAGIQLGQRFFTRRQITYDISSKLPVATPHTTGALRIVAVNDTTAIASVTFACDGVREGDYLAPFDLPDVIERPAGPAGEPDFAEPMGRVLFGPEVRDTVAAGDFFLVDRGASGGFMPGQRLAIFRDLRKAGVPLASVGDALVTAAAADVAVVRLLSARDVVLRGDYLVRTKVVTPR